MKKNITFTLGEFLDENPCQRGVHLFLKLMTNIEMPIYMYSSQIAYNLSVTDPDKLNMKFTAKSILKKVFAYEKSQGQHINSGYIYWLCNIFKYPEVIRFSEKYIRKESAKKFIDNKDGYIIDWWVYSVLTMEDIGKLIRKSLTKGE